MVGVDDNLRAADLALLVAVHEAVVVLGFNRGDLLDVFLGWLPQLLSSGYLQLAVLDSRNHLGLVDDGAVSGYIFGLLGLHD